MYVLLQLLHIGNHVPMSQQNVVCGQFCAWPVNPQKVSIIVFVV